MSRVFVDTSAFFALLVATDRNHARAAELFARLAAEEAQLITTSYVLVETYALLGRRVGLDAVRDFRRLIAPLLEVIWVGPEVHERALDLLLERARRRLSLVDAVSFVTISEQRLERAFAFDRHFEEARIRTL